MKKRSFILENIFISDIVTLLGTFFEPLTYCTRHPDILYMYLSAYSVYADLISIVFSELRKE